MSKNIREPGPDNMEGTKPSTKNTENKATKQPELLPDNAGAPQTPENGTVVAANQENGLKRADVKPESVKPDRELKSVFQGLDSFDLAQRMARMLCSSSLVPKEYQGEQNISNAVIALEMAQRIGASPMAVMQNLYIVHGKPGWSAQFIIASLNSCGRYSPLRFRMAKDENGINVACHAEAVELATGELLEGPQVSIAMAKAEGWYQKIGSKWQTMPDVMLRYRAASFFGKLYAPDILMGMQSAEELGDIIEGEIDDGTTGADDLNATLGVAS